MGIANPAGALALAAVAVLIALTLFQRRTRVRRVSSLLLWGQLQAAPVERRRFRVDLLFLLQLALLLALIGGYVRPYLEGAVAPSAGTALVAVLDCSASMQTREDDGGTRFALARTRLQALLAALPSGAPVMLVTAADRAHVALRWTSEPERVAAALAALEPVETSARLGPAVELALGAASARAGATVVVLTDLPPAPELRHGPVRWIQVGRTDDNVAITALRVDAAPFADRRDTRVVASVRNFAAHERTTIIDASVDGVPWRRHVLRLPPRGSEDVLFERPSASGIVHVRLTGGDALAADDEAFGWLPMPTPPALVLVTEADPMAAAFSALASALPDARLEVVNAAGWRERGSAGTAGQVVVFDRLALAAAGPALYVAPPPGDGPCGGVRRVDGGAAVIDWDDDHPILDGVDGLHALEVGAVVQLGTPSWARVVALGGSRTATFPLVLAGERDGHRQACLGAALPVPLTSSDALPLLVLTLGTLRWLAADTAELPTAVATGHLARHVGVHRVGERTVLASLLDATESDVARDGGGDWAATDAPRLVATRAARVDVGWWLYALGAVLLAVEWMVGARR